MNSLREYQRDLEVLEDLIRKAHQSLRRHDEEDFADRLAAISRYAAEVLDCIGGAR